ncbi:thioesterase family protein [Streptomyces sp. MB09-02B]|uniref:acyl-CoA thioesterase n=1 Tax=Streptomyces sp. MB09-02B TaxID=3028667 RepID=UPI0029ACC964|nr:thioesterase family protein [Streptomyces sp. MB09-02B]MDX3640504.1 thioesterase family protein [Streptomyces sp. MB09-02B]
MNVHQHRVRYHEADAQGFLFNARYLELADVAMTEFFRKLGWPYGELVAAGADPSVVSATLSFRKPARFDDLLNISAHCTRVGVSSFGLEVEVTRGADAIATVQLVYVNVDAASATSRPLPDRVSAALRAVAA